MYQKRQTKHSDIMIPRSSKNIDTHAPEYKIWHSMIARCTNSGHIHYRSYGGRGITVCERWLKSFLNFYTDMGQRPSSQHSIDRIEVNGNYTPENCKWATAKEQAYNRRNTIHDEYTELLMSGKMTQKTAHYYRNKKRGKCVNCGNMTGNDKTLCYICAKKTSNIHRSGTERAKKAGLCISCRKIKIHRANKCRKCYSLQLKRVADIRKQHIAKGLCRSCNKPIYKWNLCIEHYNYKIESDRKRRLRLKIKSSKNH